jgi:23S rRNA (uracil1939-C5)-methyltransferase
MAGCLVEHEAIARAADELERAASELGWAPERASSSAGALQPRPPAPGGPPTLRAVWLKTDGAGAVLACLVTSSSDAQALAPLGARLSPTIGLSFSSHQGEGDGLRGEAATPLSGPTALAIEVGGARFDVGPLGFLQPNPRVAELAYRDLVASPAGEPVAGGLALDLYAGSGATTAMLRERFAQVVGCEAYPESAERLGTRAETADALLARLLAEQPGSPPELVVANPPRAGLGPTTSGLLRKLGPPRLQLMSCSPSALVRDLASLGAGPTPEGSELRDATGASYRLLGLRAYDTLPQTPHVELVAWLERADG